MAKQEYYYILVRKDNAKPAVINGCFPMYFWKSVIKCEALKIFGYDWRKLYTIQKIKIDAMENLILKSKKA